MAAEELSEKDFNREFEAFIAGMKAAKHRPPVSPPPPPPRGRREAAFSR